MPCNCDHMEPTASERKWSQVACLIDELDGKKFNRSHWNGFHPKVYSQTYDRYCGAFDKNKSVARLVDTLRANDPKEYSLEMQIWWRDYQEAMEVKKREQEKAAEEERVRKQALSKLSEAELRALKLK